MGWFETAGKNISTAWSGFSAADTASSAGDGLSSAGSWAKNFAVETADAVVDWGAGYTKFALGAGSNLRIPYTDIPITPIGMAHDISNAIAPDSAMAKWMREGKEDASTYGKYAANNPARALADPAQGLVSSVGTVVGIVGEIGRVAVDYNPGALGYNLGTAVVNLGMEDNEKKAYWETGNFGDALKWTIKKSEIEHWKFLDMSEDTRKLWTAPQEYNDEGLPNPYYRYQRNGRAGGQALGDVVTMVPGAIFTGGALGFAYAGLRGTAFTAKTMGTVSHLRKLDTLNDALKVSSKIEKAAEDVVKATKHVDDLKTSGASAAEIARAEEKVKAAAKAAEKLTQTESSVVRKLQDAREKVKEKGVTTQEAVYKEAKDLEKAQKALDNAKASGADAEKIAKLEEKVTKAEDAVTKKAARAEDVGATPSDSLAKIDFSGIGTLRNSWETMLNYGHIGNRFTNPLYDGRIGTTVNATLTVASLHAYAWATDEYEREMDDTMQARKNAMAGDDVNEEFARMRERILRVQQQQQNGLKTAAPAPEATLAEAPASLRVQFKSINEMPAAGEKGGYADIFRNSAEKPIVVIFTGLPRDDNTQIPEALLQQPTNTATQYKNGQ